MYCHVHLFTSVYHYQDLSVTKHLVGYYSDKGSSVRFVKSLFKTFIKLQLRKSDGIR